MPEQTTAGTLLACPPSAVRDMIVPWEEVGEGDLILWNGEFRLVAFISVAAGIPGLPILLLDDENHACVPTGTYAAVRRYEEG